MVNRIACFILLFVLCLSACQPATDSAQSQRHQEATSASTSTSAAAPSVLPNLLVSYNARVEVRRKDSLIPVPVAFGASLQPGDVITVKEGQAAIFCGAESEWSINPLPLSHDKPAGVPCGAGRPPRPYPDAAIVRSHSGDGKQEVTNELIVISPRGGWVLNDRPTLVWSDLAGATSYTVTMESDDGLIRTTVATGSPIAYPAEWEPLQGEGASYLLLVQTADLASDDPEAGFSLIENQEALLSQVERLRQHPVEEPMRTLLLAELYLSYSLYSEAVELLVTLPDAGEIIAVQSLLGETYLLMGLVDKGRAAYERMLAQADGYPESQAQALIGLGLAFCATRNLGAAQHHWSQAYDLYDQHGLAAQAEMVKTIQAESAKQCN
jgi:hypothetical protein